MGMRRQLTDSSKRPTCIASIWSATCGRKKPFCSGWPKRCWTKRSRRRSFSLLLWKKLKTLTERSRDTSGWPRNWKRAGQCSRQGRRRHSDGNPFELQQRHVGCWRRGDDLGRNFFALGKLDDDAIRRLHDVRRGQDFSVSRNQDAGTDSRRLHKFALRLRRNLPLYGSHSGLYPERFHMAPPRITRCRALG